jgi:hypothetical protein
MQGQCRRRTAQMVQPGGAASSRSAQSSTVAIHTVVVAVVSVDSVRFP